MLYFLNFEVIIFFNILRLKCTCEGHEFRVYCCYINIRKLPFLRVEKRQFLRQILVWCHFITYCIIKYITLYFHPKKSKSCVHNMHNIHRIYNTHTFTDVCKMYIQQTQLGDIYIYISIGRLQVHKRKLSFILYAQQPETCLSPLPSHTHTHTGNAS